jgi:hypothetical protein
MNRSYLNRNLLMLRSESLQSKLKFMKRSGIPFLCLLVVFLMVGPSAFGQDFNLTMAPFSPFAVAPGQDSAANITVTGLNTFSGTVDLTCAITSQTQGNPPACEVSPPSVKASGGATVTILTGTNNAGVISPALYTVTITGTATGENPYSASQNLTVLSVIPQFTITVQTPVAPNSVPAGSGAQGTISVNPINGYVSPGYPQQGVTLSCASISPLVAIPPVCSFTYPGGAQGVPVNGSPNTATITITAQGPTITGAVAHPRGVNALWMTLPMLALVGLGTALGGKRSRKAWGLLALFVVSGSLLLMPACANSSTTTTTPNGVTPPNSYTFTVIGVDTAGNVSSNTGSTGTNPAVTLTVTAPTPAN